MNIVCGDGSAQVSSDVHLGLHMRALTEMRWVVVQNEVCDSEVAGRRYPGAE